MAKDIKMYLNNLYLNKTNNFDFIRFILASLVLYSHSYILYYGQNSLELKNEFIHYITNGLIDGGAIAVNLFFVVSGFLITISWFNTKSHIHFIIKRLLRILPGFIALMAITIFIIVPLLTSDLELYINHISIGNIIKDFVKLTISPISVMNIFEELPKNSINIFYILSPLIIILPMAYLFFNVILLSFKLDKYFSKLYIIGGITNLSMIFILFQFLEKKIIAVSLSLLITELLIMLLAYILIKNKGLMD